MQRILGICQQIPNRRNCADISKCSAILDCPRFQTQLLLCRLVEGTEAELRSEWILDMINFICEAHEADIRQINVSDMPSQVRLLVHKLDQSLCDCAAGYLRPHRQYRQLGSVLCQPGRAGHGSAVRWGLQHRRADAARGLRLLRRSPHASACARPRQGRVPLGLCPGVLALYSR